MTSPSNEMEIGREENNTTDKRRLSQKAREEEANDNDNWRLNREIHRWQRTASVTAKKSRRVGESFSRSNNKPHETPCYPVHGKATRPSNFACRLQ